MSRLFIVAPIASLFVVQTAKAQGSAIWAADASVGPAHVRGGEFVNSSSFERIAASVRKNLRHGMGLDAEVGYDWLGNLVTNPDLNCAADFATGGCLPYFPSIAGPSAVVGLSFDAASAVELRVNVGVAAYSVESSPNDSHSASAVKYNARLGAPVTAIDVAPFPNSWITMVVGGRAFVVPNYRGDRLSVTTWHLGLRLQRRQ
jgi:hypothetical protein